MSNIDELLRQARTPEPRREVSANFTDRVVTELKAPPRAPRKESFIMQLVHKPILATVLAASLIIAIGGTTYAVTDGFTKPFDFGNIFGYREQTQPDSSKVVTIQTTDCSRAELFDTSKTPSVSDQLYLRIPDNSDLSTEDALRFVQGYCERTLNQPKYIQLFDRFYNDTIQDVPTYFAGEVESIKNNKIRVKSASQYFSVFTDVTITNDTQIENDFEPAVLTAIKPGQSVIGWHTQKSDEAYDALDDQNTAIGDGFYVNALSAAEGYFSRTAFMQEDQMERVTPCQNDASKFCSWSEETQRDFDVSTLKGDALEAYQFVSKAYSDYMRIDERVDEYGLLDGQPPETLEKFKQNTTPELAKSFEVSYGYDPVTCLQSDILEPRFSRPVEFAGKQVLVLSGHFEESTPESYAEITYDPAIDKITSISCVVSRGL
jgi:hypothetical protein